MGDLWRSKKMSLVQLVVQNGAAHAVVSKLGELGMMQLRDVRAALASAPVHSSQRGHCICVA